jgi:branched-chain amino acid transport system substrate-binding protein
VWRGSETPLGQTAPMRRALPVVIAVTILATGAIGRAEVTRRGGDGPRGVTDTTIRVGGLGDAGLYGDAEVGARARFQRANREGELPGGRTIEFVRFADDKSDAVLDETEARTLIEEDQVFAIVPVVTPAFESNRFFDRRQVPVVGWGIAPGFCGNDYAFGFSGCLVPPADAASNVWGLLIERYLEEPSSTAPLTSGGSERTKRAAVVADDDSAGRNNERVVTAAAEDAGLDVVYAEHAVPAAGAPDYTPVATEILAAADGQPPDVVFLTGAFSNVIGISGKLRELGYQGVLTNALGYDPRLASVQDGVTALVGFEPFESASTNPTMQRLIDDVRAVQADAALTPQLAAGYFAADLFVKVARKVGRQLTPKRFLGVANDDFEWRLKRTAGPTTFPAGHTVPTPCGALVLSDGSAFQVALPYRCGELIES